MTQTSQSAASPAPARLLLRRSALCGAALIAIFVLLGAQADCVFAPQQSASHSGPPQKAVALPFVLARTDTARHDAPLKALAMQSIATNVSSAAIDIVQRDGSVSMHVHDAPLGEVLSAVQRLTRASVEATDVADEERVTVDVGPMPVLEVMETMQFMAKHIGAVVATATRAANSTDAAGIQSDFEPRLCYAYGMFTAIADSRAMNRYLSDTLSEN